MNNVLVWIILQLNPVYPVGISVQTDVNAACSVQAGLKGSTILLFFKPVKGAEPRGNLRAGLHAVECREKIGRPGHFCWRYLAMGR